MTGRITKEILRKKVENINNSLNLTTGRYTLEYAYGGVRLCKYVNEHGGLSDCSERVNNATMAIILDTLYNSIHHFGLVITKQ